MSQPESNGIAKQAPKEKALLSFGTLRVLILLGATLSLLIPFLALSWINYNASREWARHEITTSALPLTRDNIFSEIHADLLQPLYVASTMANDSFLKDWATDNEEDRTRITRYLSTIHRKYNYPTVFFISARTLHYYHYEKGLHKVIKPEDKHDQWYYRFLERNIEYDLDVDTDEATDNELTIFINFRVEGGGGSLLGVTGVGLKMDTVARLLKSTQIKYNRRIFLVDRQGVIQAHADTALVDQASIHNRAGIRDIAAQILSTRKRPSDHSYNSPEGRIYLTVRYIPEFDWFLIVEQDESIALVSARNNLIRTTLVGFCLWCLLSGLTLWVVHRHYKRLSHLVRTDSLTGLANRRHFEQQFEIACYRYNRHEEDFCLILMDLDEFKRVNDVLGHLAGDALLKETALEMQKALRPTDQLARWGGDEFIVLTACKLDEAEQVARRLKNAVQCVAQRLGKEGTNDPRCDVSASCGVVPYEDAMSLDRLTQQADTLLYECKRTGGDSIATENAST